MTTYRGLEFCRFRENRESIILNYYNEFMGYLLRNFFTLSLTSLLSVCVCVLLTPEYLIHDANLVSH